VAKNLTGETIMIHAVKMLIVALIICGILGALYDDYDRLSGFAQGVAGGVFVLFVYGISYFLIYG